MLATIVFTYCMPDGVLSLKTRKNCLSPTAFLIPCNSSVFISLNAIGKLFAKKILPEKVYLLCYILQGFTATQSVFFAKKMLQCYKKNYKKTKMSK